MIDTLNQMTGGQAPVVLAVIILLITYVLAIAIRNSRALREGAAWGPRVGKYIGIAAQGWLLTGAVLAIVWCLVLRNEGDTFAAAVNEMGLHLRLPVSEVAAWSAAMVVASMVASFVVARLRKFFGGGPTAAGLDILPETPAETAVFSLLVAPTAGVGEEIVYRGFLLGQLGLRR